MFTQCSIGKEKVVFFYTQDTRAPVSDLLVILEVGVGWMDGWMMAEYSIAVFKCSSMFGCWWVGR